MTVYVLGIVAAAFWIASSHEPTPGEKSTDVFIALGCALAAVILAIV